MTPPETRFLILCRRCGWRAQEDRQWLGLRLERHGCDVDEPRFVIRRIVDYYPDDPRVKKWFDHKVAV